MSWDSILVATTVANGLLVFGYRVYRLTKGGPTYDAIGGAILAVALAGTAAGYAAGAGWVRWAALVYGALFAVVVMPLWTLAVLLPMRPGTIDLAFTTVYWATLVLIAVAAAAA